MGGPRSADPEDVARRIVSARPELADTVVVVGANLLDAGACLALRLDAAEHQRRAAAGLEAVTDRALLRLFCTLPLGHAVDERDLAEVDQRRLRASPAGVVAAGGGNVVRLARPPVMLACAVVVDMDWSTGLDRASVFAAFAPRVLALPTAPAGPEREQLCLEAALYGIGVATSAADVDVEFLTEPAPVPPRPLGAAAWRVRELAYDALLRSQRAAVAVSR